MFKRVCIALSITVSVLLSLPASAQDNQRLLELSNQIKDLQAEIEPLKALLQGAVIAFHRSENEGACPPRWKRFEPAAGRFVVGAGVNTWTDVAGRPLKDHPSLKDDSAGAVGGEEVHQLSIGEMPVHNHNNFDTAEQNDYNQLLTYRKDNGYTGKYFDGSVGELAYQNGRPITSAGGDQPHNNMPPYIALYYCIKE